MPILLHARLLRYLGKGVLKAVENINAIIAPALKVGRCQTAGRYAAWGCFDAMRGGLGARGSA